MYIWTREGLGQAIPTITVRPDIIKPANARLTRFDTNSGKLKDFHAVEIDRVADKIAASWQGGEPVRTVKVIGHTSSEGPAQYNIGLGLHRALAVRRALQKALERRQKNLSYKVLVLAASKGLKEPIDTNETEEGKSQNRRVEVFLSTKMLLPLPKKKTEVKPSPIRPETIPWVTDFPREQIPSDREGRPPCNKGEWSRLINVCIQVAKACAVICTATRVRGFLKCKDPVCRAKEIANYWLCVRKCRDTLNVCRGIAERATNCKEGDW